MVSDGVAGSTRSSDALDEFTFMTHRMAVAAALRECWSSRCPARSCRSGGWYVMPCKHRASPDESTVIAPLAQMPRQRGALEEQASRSDR